MGQTRTLQTRALQTRTLKTQPLKTRTCSWTLSISWVTRGTLSLLTAATIVAAGSIANLPAATAQTISAITYPTLAAGSTGDTVSRLQATLKLLGYYQGGIDGSYSPATQSAVAQFQTDAGLAADGITGPSTWRKLLPPPEDIAGTAATQPPVQPAAQPAAEPRPQTLPAEPVATAPAAPAVPQGPPILRPEVEGSAVSQLQRELQQLGYYNGEIDGVYGELTQAAVKNFQADQQIEVDAVVGPSTWDALTRALS